jgi:glutamine amidotransferase
MRRPVNGDGFGVGYYPEDKATSEGPAIFTAITPAWSNMNLERLASKTQSTLVFAHVRASTSGALAEINCHPWSYHSLMWMHNGSLWREINVGSIGGFDGIKRRLVNSLRDEYFIFVQGNTDSEWAFAVFLNELANLGVNPAEQKKGGFGHAILRQAMMNTIAAINGWCEEVNEKEPSLLNFAATDGEAVVCSRYVSSSTEQAASLFFRYLPYGFIRLVPGLRSISMSLVIFGWRGEIKDRISFLLHPNH